MKITKRSEALKNSGSVIKYCSGKYKWHGSQSAYVGNDIELPKDSNVVAIWVERRSDKHGPYACLMCKTLSDQKLGK